MGLLNTLLASGLVPLVLAGRPLAWGNDQSFNQSSSPQHGLWSGAQSHSYNGNSYAGNWSQPGLSQNSTNGKRQHVLYICQALVNRMIGCSTFGTFDHGNLDKWVDGPMPHGSDRPWGRRHVNDTNPYVVSNVPNTGMLSYYINL